MDSFGMRRDLSTSYEDALVNVTEALKTEGFGVLTEIDVQATLKKKLGVDFRKYKILGACNPPFAHEALNAELEIGLMLPCNVLVYEGDNGKAVVVAVDPMKTVASTGNTSLAGLAEKVRDKLQAALSKLE